MNVSLIGLEERTFGFLILGDNRAHIFGDCPVPQLDSTILKL